MVKIDMDTLRKYIHYDADTGIFTWLYQPKKSTIKAGSQAGCTCAASGYVLIGIQKRYFRAHRLAWFYTYNEWPDVIDHINGIKNDNRIINLRNVDTRGNAQNKTWHRDGDLVGAHWHKVHQKWASSVCIDGKLRHLGLFATEQEAHAAYNRALDNPSSVKSKIEEKVKRGIPVGIHWRERYQCYCVAIKRKGKVHHFGSFKSLDDAIQRLAQARHELAQTTPFMSEWKKAGEGVPMMYSIGVDLAKEGSKDYTSVVQTTLDKIFGEASTNHSESPGAPLRYIKGAIHE